VDVALVQFGQGPKDIVMVDKPRMTHGFIFQQTLKTNPGKIITCEFIFVVYVK
jgi:hypothetical protein